MYTETNNNNSELSQKERDQNISQQHIDNKPDEKIKVFMYFVNENPAITTTTTTTNTTITTTTTTSTTSTVTITTASPFLDRNPSRIKRVVFKLKATEDRHKKPSHLSGEFHSSNLDLNSELYVVLDFVKLKDDVKDVHNEPNSLFFKPLFGTSIETPTNQLSNANPTSTNHNKVNLRNTNLNTSIYYKLLKDSLSVTKHQNLNALDETLKKMISSYKPPNYCVSQETMYNKKRIIWFLLVMIIYGESLTFNNLTDALSLALIKSGYSGLGYVREKMYNEGTINKNALCSMMKIWVGRLAERIRRMNSFLRTSHFIPNTANLLVEIFKGYHVQYSNTYDNTLGEFKLSTKSKFVGIISEEQAAELNDQSVEIISGVPHNCKFDPKKYKVVSKLSNGSSFLDPSTIGLIYRFEMIYSCNHLTFIINSSDIDTLEDSCRVLVNHVSGDNTEEYDPNKKMKVVDKVLNSMVDNNSNTDIVSNITIPKSHEDETLTTTHLKKGKSTNLLLDEPEEETQTENIPLGYNFSEDKSAQNIKLDTVAHTQDDHKPLKQIEKQDLSTKLLEDDEESPYFSSKYDTSSNSSRNKDITDSPNNKETKKKKQKTPKVPKHPKSTNQEEVDTDTHKKKQTDIKKKSKSTS